MIIDEIENKKYPHTAIPKRINMVLSNAFEISLDFIVVFFSNIKNPE